MKKHKIATIINFCSNDTKYLKYCIEGVKEFSDTILVPICTHFFDGTKENRTLLEKVYASFDDCIFIEYKYDPEVPYGNLANKRQGDLDWPRHWHSTSRTIGYYFVPDDTDYILFIDTDEIVDSTKFCQWLDTFEYTKYNALRFLSYEYFREPCFQSEQLFTTGLLVKKMQVSGEVILNIDERLGIFKKINEPKIIEVLSITNQPMIHHYSWVRSKEEMIKKVSTWGHYWEKNWIELIEKEFSQEFSGKDFRTGSTYKKITPNIDLSLDFDLPAIRTPIAHHYVDQNKFIELAFWNVCSMIKNT